MRQNHKECNLQNSVYCTTEITLKYIILDQPKQSRNVWTTYDGIGNVNKYSRFDHIIKQLKKPQTFNVKINICLKKKKSALLWPSALQVLTWSWTTALNAVHDERGHAMSSSLIENLIQHQPCGINVREFTTQHGSRKWFAQWAILKAEWNATCYNYYITDYSPTNDFLLKLTTRLWQKMQINCLTACCIFGSMSYDMAKKLNFSVIEKPVCCFT